MYVCLYVCQIYPLIYILGPSGAATEVDHMHITEVGVMPVLHSVMSL